MKTICLLFTLIGVTLVGCTNRDNQVDLESPMSDGSTLTNSEIQECKSEIATIDNILQESKNIYMSLNDEEKQKVWIKKLDETLKLEWSNEEKAHINSLKEYIASNKNIFSDDNRESFSVFSQEWTDKAANELKWSRKTIAAITTCVLPLKDKNGNIDTTKQIEI